MGDNPQAEACGLSPHTDRQTKPITYGCPDASSFVALSLHPTISYCSCIAVYGNTVFPGNTLPMNTVCMSKGSISHD